MDSASKGNNAVFTLKEAAAYLRLSEITVLRFVNRGVIAGTKIGRQWRFSKEVIVNLVKETSHVPKS